MKLNPCTDHFKTINTLIELSSQTGLTVMELTMLIRQQQNTNEQTFSIVYGKDNLNTQELIELT